MNLRRAVDLADDAHLLGRAGFRDDFRRQVGPAQRVPAEQRRVADDRRRVVDLMVVKIIDAELGQERERPAGLQRRENAAVAVGALYEAVTRSPSSSRPVSASTAGMFPWRKKKTVSGGRPKNLCSFKVLLGFLGGGVTGHHQKTESAGPPA